jgi:hypothetical protein
MAAAVVVLVAPMVSEVQVVRHQVVAVLQGTGGEVELMVERLDQTGRVEVEGLVGTISLVLEVVPQARQE